MTDLDRETTTAVQDLAVRLRDRDPEGDDELFAREFMLMLRGRGWRPTEARAPHQWKALPAGGGSGLPKRTDTAELVRKARADAESAAAAFQADHRDNPDHGAAV